MKQFNFTVRGDYITKDGDYTLIEGNKGSYEAVFDFDAEWEEMAKMCIVENGTDVYKIAIIENICLLPEMCGSSAKVGVIGVDAADEELVTRISTNMVAIGVQDGAASPSVTATLDSAATIWEKYLSEMESSRQAAEEAAEAAEVAAEKAKEAAEAAAEEAAADTAEKVEAELNTYVINAEVAAEAADGAFVQAEKEREAAEKAREAAEAAAEEAAADTAEKVEAELNTYVINAETAATEAAKNAESAATSEANAKEAAVSAEASKKEAADYASSAEESDASASSCALSASESEEAAKQAFSDLLAMINSGDIVLATDGVLPLSSIPATATQEIYTVTSEDELTALSAQRGDLAELIEEIDGEQTITKTWQCLGDASARESWVVWGTSYAVQAGNAATADNATNANMINNHRIVEMTEEEFEAAVKDENTYYLVY